MSIAGYNVDPESSDSVVCVDLVDGSKATICIDEGQGCIEVPLSYDEVGELIDQLQEILGKMTPDLDEVISLNNS